MLNPTLRDPLIFKLLEPMRISLNFIDRVRHKNQSTAGSALVCSCLTQTTIDAWVRQLKLINTQAVPGC